MSKIIKKGAIKREPGKLYFIDGKGNVCEANMKNAFKSKRKVNVPEGSLKGYSDYKIADHKDAIEQHKQAIAAGKDKAHHMKYIAIHKELIKEKTPSFKK